MKRNTSLFIVLTLLLSFTTTVFAKPTEVMTSNDELSAYIEQDMKVQSFSNEEHDIYTITITDEKELKKIQQKEHKDGQLVERTISYIIPKDEQIAQDHEITPMATATYTIGNWTQSGNRFYYTNEGVPFRIEGKADFTHKVSTTTAYSMTGEGSGNVKGLVEIKLGGSFSKAKTTDWEVKVEVPEGYYRDFEIWEYLTKYEFNVLKDGKTYTTGCEAYKPNGGQRLTNDLYKK